MREREGRRRKERGSNVQRAFFTYSLGIDEKEGCRDAENAGMGREWQTHDGEREEERIGTDKCPLNVNGAY